jgi:hypothetical protein
MPLFDDSTISSLRPAATAFPYELEARDIREAVTTQREQERIVEFEQSSPHKPSAGGKYIVLV